MLQSEFSVAEKLDSEDQLRAFKDRFYIPLVNGKESVYLCGNSLGCMPKSAREAVEVEFKDWELLGVEGHVHGTNPWLYYHHRFSEQVAELVGARKDEVVVMNNLTTNLHLMMVSFYRPDGKRTKIITEAGAFPSDHYALESQARHHGLDPEDTIIEISPRRGEHTLRTEDIVEVIRETGDSLALVMMGGVNYYTGQFFELQKITKAAHAVGGLCGFDLAHAVGNVELQLHDWSVDFAIWCSYKYLNSGPGGTSGVYIHERWSDDPSTPRFAGWWGHHEAERFLMKKGFIPMKGAAGWQLSNAQIFPMAIHKSSLDIFSEAGMPALRAKSVRMSSFLESLIDRIILDHPDCGLEIITPREAHERGCQVSLLAHKNGKELFDALSREGVIVDWREPNVIRLAPVPLYNGFVDCWKFASILEKEIAGKSFEH